MDKYTAEQYEARNRALLYTRTISLSPTESVATALEALEKTENSSLNESYINGTMSKLNGILEEKGISFQVKNEQGETIKSMPEMKRTIMIPEGMGGNLFQKLGKAIGRILRFKEPTSKNSKLTNQTEWEKTVSVRRLVLTLLTVLPSLFAALILYSLFEATAWKPLLFVSTALFGILFYWISLGFWSFIIGTFIVLKKYDNFSFKHSVSEDVPFPNESRTALLFPVYNEDAQTVCAGIRTVWQSLQEAGIEKHFDIFILSDSTKADAWVNEEEAWRELCLLENAHEHIFYRHRKMNIKRKSGNIADFCRRWGSQYKYMIIFDADSLMSAYSLKRLVQIMEKNPSVGIVQSPPKVIKSQSLIARVQQFANHLYGPVFAAGLSFWRLGNTQYWGHNAIIRVDPFIKHCQLPKLSGNSPLGGEILSHDFVESALMRRAGYGVWLAYELDGSYEQSPPSLIDELIRDRRWCQGNLQHSRLIFTAGFFPTHRALFINGIMSYVSALLWLFFLLASSAQVIMELFIIPDYFPSEPSLLPNWPQYFPNWLLTLLSCTAILLFLPKIFVIALIQIKGGAKAFGGFFRMTISVILEIVISAFLAPVRMIYHSWFVISSLFGRTVGWNSQNRDDTGTSWFDAFRFHWWSTLIGGIWGWFMFLANPAFFLWFSPVALGLLFSMPLSVWTSKVSVGNFLHSLGLFLTPPDTEPSKEIINLEKNLDRSDRYSPFDIQLNVPEKSGFIRAVVMYSVLSLHLSLAQMRKKTSLSTEALVDKALNEGPNNLTNAEKNLLLHNPRLMLSLHHKLWASSSACISRWGIETR